LKGWGQGEGRIGTPLPCAFFGYFLGTQESNVKKKKIKRFIPI